jgi:hypothetical protein
MWSRQQDGTALEYWQMWTVAGTNENAAKTQCMLSHNSTLVIIKIKTYTIAWDVSGCSASQIFPKIMKSKMYITVFNRIHNPLLSQITVQCSVQHNTLPTALPNQGTLQCSTEHITHCSSKSWYSAVFNKTHYPLLSQITVLYSVRQKTLPTPLPSHEQFKSTLNYFINIFITVPLYYYTHYINHLTHKNDTICCTAQLIISLPALNRQISLLLTIWHGWYCKTQQDWKCSNVCEWKTECIVILLLYRQSNIVIMCTGKKQDCQPLFMTATWWHVHERGTRPQTGNYHAL